MSIDRVGVIGCGLMGAGIAEVCARAGLATVVREVNDEFLAGGLERIRGSLARSVKKGKASDEEAEATLGRITGTTELGDLAECDLIVEAIVENLEEKCRTFAELDRTAKGS